MVAKPLNLPALSSSDSSSSTSNRIQNQNTNAISSILPGIATAVNGSVENSGSAANTNIEHIRQGLLSIHTLVSTMDPSDFSYSDSSEAKSMNGVDSIGIPADGIDWNSSMFTDENGKIRTEDTTDSSSMKDDDKSRPSKRGRSEVNFRNNYSPNRILSQDNSSADRTKRFFRGQWVDVKDTVSQWLEATIMDIDYENFNVYVHYNGWPERWDEWIAFDSPRISPFRSRTTHSSLNSFLSPAPNILVPSAPCTGSNDVRLYIPEFSRLLNMLQPAMEELACLAEDSLKEKPAADYDAAEYFPWESVGLPALRATEVGCKGPADLPIAGEGITNSSGRQKAPLVPPYREGEPSNSDPSSLSRKRAGDSSSTYSSDSSSNRSWIKTPPIHYGDVDEKEEVDESAGDIQQKKKQRQHQKEARFRHLAKELCPLIDRFGRALTDMAPFLRELAESPVDEGSTSSTAIPAESGTSSTSSSSRGSSSDPPRSQFSLEASLLSFLRERPPSPPPERAYRAPITNHPRGPLTAGAIRGVAANSGSLLTDILNAAGMGSSNTGLSTTALLPLSSQSTQGVDGHHLDIHIAILSPPSSRASMVTSGTSDFASANSGGPGSTSGSVLSQAVNNLTASLQAQAQSLALRTQQLSDRTAAVTGYSQAISEILRTANSSGALVPSSNTVENSESSAESDNLDSSISSIQARSRSVDLTAQSIRDARIRIQELNRTLSALSSSASQFSSALASSNHTLDTANSEGDPMQEGNEGDEDEDASENGLLDDLLLPEQVADAIEPDSRLLEIEDDPPHEEQEMEMEEVTSQTEEVVPETEENRESNVNSSPPNIRPPAITPPSVFERIRRSLNFVP
eukprot:gene34125-44093_t